MKQLNNMKLIAGLGNPGKKYEKTRHNIGFRVLDAFDLSWKENKKLKSLVAKNNDWIFLKPQTFMNNSSEAVAAVKQFYKIKPQDIIVIYDDIALPFGKLRIRVTGSAGGHKGVDSIIKKMKSPNFTRLRVGIANNRSDKIPSEKFVLQKFNANEEKKLKKIIKTAAEAINKILDEGAHRAMNEYN